MLKLAVVILLSSFFSTRAYPVKNQRDSVDYLTRFGYMSPDVKNLVSQQAAAAKLKVREGLKNFQYFAGLPTTGVLDTTTLQAMNFPRCGNGELEKEGGSLQDSTGNRRKRFVVDAKRRKRFVVDSKWEKIYLSYKIMNYPTSGPNSTVIDEVIRKAFEYWTNVANIHVQPTRAPVQKADIEISFVRGKHNDGIEFDVVENVGRVVAHAWKPFNAEPLRGDMHFNDEVTWGVEESRPAEGGNVTAYDFFHTAVHEAGHALGLEHSPNREAMMFFAVTGHKQAVALTKDDIQGIQLLYGPKPGSSAQLNTNWRVTKTDSGGPVRRPIVVPSGTPQANVPWECYLFQEQNPRDEIGIKQCYQQFYRDYYRGRTR